MSDSVTPKCGEVVRILSGSMDSRLSLSTRLKLRLHYLICAWCWRYEKKLHEVPKFAILAANHADSLSGELLSPGAKDRIVAAMLEITRKQSGNRENGGADTGTRGAGLVRKIF